MSFIFVYSFLLWLNVACALANTLMGSYLIALLNVAVAAWMVYYEEVYLR